MKGPRKHIEGVNDDDRQLFRDAVRDVTRLKLEPRIVAAKPKMPPRARFSAADRAAVLIESLDSDTAGDWIETGDEVSFRRAGIKASIVGKLRRGEYRVDAECDLHGLNVEECKRVLREFLAEALARDLHCVRVIHGKGLRSGPRGPVLKVAVNLVLRKTGPVVAFCTARPIDGGTGALYVLLAGKH
ncbi:MAG: Smr/MutS family protein [Pseudomonadales bacterium]|nr:Smr/MutS family protein [Pseudomonadales bacterium]